MSATVRLLRLMYSKVKTSTLAAARLLVASERGNTYLSAIFFYENGICVGGLGGGGA